MKVYAQYSTWLAVLLAFWAFWVSEGWSRIDCALGIQAGCKAIEAEYTAYQKWLDQTSKP